MTMPEFRRRCQQTMLRWLTPLLLYLIYGRWQDIHYAAAFHRGAFDRAVRLPPLFRALAATPDGWQLLRRVAHYLWHQERGTLDPTGPPDLGGNLFTAWTGPGVAFLHLEKCGGIALVQWLTQQFHPLQIERDPWRDLPPNFYWRAPASLPTDAARYPLIWGHYDVPSLRRLAPGRFIFTLLREPRGRLLSLYKFWRSVDPSRVDLDISFSVALAHRMTFEEFLASDDPMLLDLIDNFYVRRLTGLYATGEDRDPVAASPDRAFNTAVHVMEGLGFVGITERLDESAVRLATRLGIAPPPPSLRANVAAENHTDPSGWFRGSDRIALSPEIEAALARRTVLDRALYARALAGFNRAAAQPEIAIPA